MALWLVAADPIYPRLTSITLTLPVSVIGPTDVVPKPTFVISIYSSLIFIVSPVVIEEIPATLNVVWLLVIAYSNVVDTGVKAIGDWIIPSIESNAFSFFLDISNSWLLPEPVLVNVTAIPARASARLLAILNLSLLLVDFIANTSRSCAKVPPPVAIPATAAPVNVDPGL